VTSKLLLTRTWTDGCRSSFQSGTNKHLFKTFYVDFYKEKKRGKTGKSIIIINYINSILGLGLEPKQARIQDFRGQGRFWKLGAQFLVNEGIKLLCGARNLVFWGKICLFCVFWAILF